MSSFEIEIPDQVPVMILPETVLFPQAMMPLYIFEARYREMLSSVLDSHRMFIVAGKMQAPESGSDDPQPEGIATIGIVRASQRNDDETSNLILQGLQRVRIQEMVQMEPYPLAKIEAIDTDDSDEGSAELAALRDKLAKLIRRKKKTTGQVPGEVLEFLENIESPESYVDLAAYALGTSFRKKQRLLEIIQVTERYREFFSMLRSEIEEAELLKQLKGDLSDEDFSRN